MYKFQFTNSLKEVLEQSVKESKQQTLIYRKHKEVLAETAKALIIFIPGWQRKLYDYQKLLEGTLKQLDKIDKSMSWELLCFQYNNGFFSKEDPKNIAKELNDKITHYLKYYDGNYEKIFLFGYSMGALIARQAALDMSKSKWLNKVNLVLLAGTNRGYSTESLDWFSAIVDKGTDIFCSELFNGFLAKKIKRGSDFVNELRLSWLRKFADSDEELSANHEKPIAPPTIQLLGNKDNIVQIEDSLEIYNFTKTEDKNLKDVTHAGFFDNDKELNLVIDEICRAFQDHCDNHHQYIKSDKIQKCKNPNQNKPDCIVFIVHGIRDFADWHEIIECAINNYKNEQNKQNKKARVVSVRYGYFSAFQFLLLSQRKKNVRAFIDRYIQEVAKYPDIPIYVIAHSYGTYLVGRAMESKPYIFINRIYFAGSVLPKDFNWGNIISNKHSLHLEAVRNDCANADWAVGVLCRFLQYLPNYKDIGTAGVCGFNNTNEETNGNYKIYDDLPQDFKRLSHQEVIIKNNKYIEGGHGACLAYQIGEEIANFLFSEQLTSKEFKLQDENKDLHSDLLINIGGLSFLGFLIVIGIFFIWIFLIPYQYLAVILASIWTFIVIWVLLSI